jgi:paraquat-inducible protein A
MSGLLVCHECDLINRVPALPEKASARCRRCGALLHKHKVNSIARTLALTLAGTVLFALANTFPFLGFQLQGNLTQTTLITGVRELYATGEPGLATLVFITSIAAPGLRLACLLYLFVPLYLNRTPRYLAPALIFVQRLHPWSMIEVFMLGILVALVKLAGMATVVAGVALWSFAVLILVMVGISAAMDPGEVWERLERRP